MSEIYDYLIEAYKKLHAIPEPVHWFCPKVSEDDLEDYYGHPDKDGEEITKEEKAKRLEDFIPRRNLAYKFCLVIGVSREQVAAWQDWYLERTHHFLTTCHLCIRNWHRQRQPFLKLLAE
jgi:senataxin